MLPATFLNFGPACSAIFLLWSFGEINQLELSIYLDIYELNAETIVIVIFCQDMALGLSTTSHCINRVNG